MVTASGHHLKCAGTADINVQVPGLAVVTISALVVEEEPLGFRVVLGMDVIQAFGGVLVSSPTEVHFIGEKLACAGLSERQDVNTEPDVTSRLSVDKEDFYVRFDESQRCWIVNWKWTGDGAPDALKNSVPQYRISSKAEAEYRQEIALWIKNGWLQVYDEHELGPPKGLIPLMAVIQQNKQKVRPVMDFREVNSHVDTFTAEMDACGEKLREWRKMGDNAALLDLHKAYLQIRVDKTLWPYQTVIVDGVRYCLTRLGFGINVAPCVMKAVLDAVARQDPDVERAMSSYIDDVLVDESVLSAEKVADHLRRFGLESKPAVRLKDGGRALGLRVSAERDGLRWRRDNSIGEAEVPLTKRKVFSLCGRLTSHLPVCGWLRPAASYLKRRANELSTSWDEPITDGDLKDMVEEVLEKVAADDPARGRWDVPGSDVTVWTDASSLALGVAIEVDGEVIEDCCWLRRDNATHINVAELDAVVKGMNMAILWAPKKLRLMTDSRTVYHWILNTLSGKMRLKTKASSEMLIRRRLRTLQMLTEEYELDVTVQCVSSAANRSDVLTRVPERWLKAAVAPGESFAAPPTKSDEFMTACAAVGDRERSGPVSTTEADGQAQREEVVRAHEAAGHPGVRKTRFFAKRVVPSVTKNLARSVVTSCQVCQSIDPAPIKWKKGELSVPEIWRRLAMDITEYRGQSFLTVIDCGPSRFAVWRPLRWKTSAIVVAELRSILFERGAPEEILLDNDPAFRSRRFEAFAAEWDVQLRYRCAYVPSGNGIAERVHRTVKTVASRKGCSISEAVYLYNSSPKDGEKDASTPSNQLYRYVQKAKLLHSRTSEQQPDPTTDGSPRRAAYDVGDAVWIRPVEARCHTKYDKGVVTRKISEQAVEVNGMPRHVRDLRHRLQAEHREVCAGDPSEDDSPLLVALPARSAEETPTAAAVDASPVLRRSERIRNRVARETQL